MSAKELN